MKDLSKKELEQIDGGVIGPDGCILPFPWPWPFPDPFPPTFPEEPIWF